MNVHVYINVLTGEIKFAKVIHGNPRTNATLHLPLPIEKMR